MKKTVAVFLLAVPAMFTFAQQVPNHAHETRNDGNLGS